MAVSACKNIAVIFDCTCCDDQGTRKSAELAKGKIANSLFSNIKDFPTEIAGVEEADSMLCYNVDNKYYSAVINLCCDEMSAEKADAILVIININQVHNYYNRLLQ